MHRRPALNAAFTDKHARQPDTVLRYTRDVLTQSIRRALLDGLSHGLAMEGLGAFESWPTGAATKEQR